MSLAHAHEGISGALYPLRASRWTAGPTFLARFPR